MTLRSLAASLLAFGLIPLSGPLQAQSVYAKAGFLGAGIGYSQGISPALTLRADITTIGSYQRNGHSSDFDYRAKLHSNQASGYLDWFPFDSGFRLTAGLIARDLKATANARPNTAGEITIGDTSVTYGANDHADARIRFPSVAPYVGLGWGHNVGQRTQPGWGLRRRPGRRLRQAQGDFQRERQPVQRPGTAKRRLGSARGREATPGLPGQGQQAEILSAGLPGHRLLFLGANLSAHQTKGQAFAAYFQLSAEQKANHASLTISFHGRGIQTQSQGYCNQIVVKSTAPDASGGIYDPYRQALQESPADGSFSLSSYRFSLDRLRIGENAIYIYSGTKNCLSSTGDADDFEIVTVAGKLN